MKTVVQVIENKKLMARDHYSNESWKARVTLLGMILTAVNVRIVIDA
jgi:hypothetical protein